MSERSLNTTTALSRERFLIMFIGIATVSGNVISSILFSCLPEDGYHLARGAIWYLCGINILGVLGVIGACVESGLTVSIFGVCLLLDAVLSTIPRMMIPILALDQAPELCLPRLYQGSAPTAQSFLENAEENLLARSRGSPTRLRLGDDGFLRSDCLSVFTWANITICILVLTAALLQVRSAVMVRAYGQHLNARRRRDDISAKIFDYKRTIDVELAAEMASTEAGGVVHGEELESHPDGRPGTLPDHVRSVWKYFG